MSIQRNYLNTQKKENTQFYLGRLEEKEKDIWTTTGQDFGEKGR
jgi:hypothetical protein